MTLARALAVAFLACAAGAAQAQEPTAFLAPSEALRCMTPPAAQRGAPVYPEQALARKERGRMRVELVFASADAAPATRWLDDGAGYDQLREAVLAHVKVLRVPCLAPGGEPARVIQEYSFEPNDGRKVMAAQYDAADAERRRQMSCLTRIVGHNVRPAYPLEALKARESGNYLLRLRFDSPTQPAGADFVSTPKRPSRSIRSEVLSFAESYRLPCLSAPSLDVHVLFSYHLEGEAKTVLRDVQLVGLLRSAKKPVPAASFDTSTMGCPFDLRFMYWQPFKDNDVREVENRNEVRRPFLAWLSSLQLDFGVKDVNAVLGDEMTVGVPCIKIDL